MGIFFGRDDYQKWLGNNQNYCRHEKLARLQPFVFSDDGIPIVIEEQDAGRTLNDLYGSDVAWRWFSGLSLGIVPVIDGFEQRQNFALYLMDSDTPDAVFRFFHRRDTTFTCFPFPGPLLLFNGDGLDSVEYARGKKVDNISVRVDHEYGTYGKGILGDVYSQNNPADAVLAHAIAVKLKELEDS